MFQSKLEQKLQQPPVSKCVDILSPIEEITRSISARLACVSIVIPYIRVVIRTLEKMKIGVYAP